MNRIIRSLFMGFLVVSCGIQGFGKKTLFGVRSQAFNTVRELTGWQSILFRPDLDSFNGTIAVAPEYSHTFRSGRIREFIFGCNEQIFSGSQVVGRSGSDILADYFGLPSDFVSTVCVDPKIVNFAFDIDAYLGLDGWAPGLYCAVRAPIVHTKWDLDLDECVTDPGVTYTSYPAGYLASTPLTLAQLTVGPQAPKTVKNALRGLSTFGDMSEPLAYGRVFGRQMDTRVADLAFTIGYNFLLTDWYHLGIAARAVAPTGTLRNSKFLFEPIAGNDHHWELGGEITGHVDCWYQESTDRSLSLYGELIVSHLFNSEQKRSFDLKNSCPGSRYMLIQNIYAPSVGLHDGLAPTDTVATSQYQGLLVPAINRTTLCASIGVKVQLDGVVKLTYKRRGFECDLGYNIWYRSPETCHERNCLPSGYALKGDAQLYGFTNPGETPVALAATQSNATLYSGQPAQPPFTGIENNFSSGFAFANINADNIIDASDDAGVGLFQLTSADANRLNISQMTVRTSNPPILLTNDDIDECSALLPRALSNKLFLYVGYTLERDELNFIPYAGGGGFVEFAHTNPDSNSAPCQWGVWFKLGLAFGM